VRPDRIGAEELGIELAASDHDRIVVGKLIALPNEPLLHLAIMPRCSAPLPVGTLSDS